MKLSRAGLAKALGNLVGHRTAGTNRKTVFLHIPKTGGTTFRAILVDLFGEKYCYCRATAIQEVRKILDNFDCVEFHVGELNGEFVYYNKEIIQESNWKYLKN